MFLFTLFLVLYVLTVIAQESSLISIRTPSLNQMVVPGQSLDITYTVHASTLFMPNYPLSMDLYLRWKKNQETHLELKAITGLSTQTIASGTQSKTYHRVWKLPHCQFFKRYSPSEWSFTVEFEMKYSEDPTKPRPLSPKQTPIVIPIQINTTQSNHHHGC